MFCWVPLRFFPAFLFCLQFFFFLFSFFFLLYKFAGMLTYLCSSVVLIACNVTPPNNLTLLATCVSVSVWVRIRVVTAAQQHRATDSSRQVSVGEWGCHAEQKQSDDQLLLYCCILSIGKQWPSPPYILPYNSIPSLFIPLSAYSVVCVSLYACD